MSRYRDQLPQLTAELFLTDGGMETTLLFHEGLEMPLFSAFVLFDDAAGRKAIEDYCARYIALARQRGLGLVLDTCTWRASADWGDRLGYSSRELARINRTAVEVVAAARDAHAGPVPVVIDGVIGPRGDGYDPGAIMTPSEAQAYHATQVATFAETAADMVSGITITNAPEAVGIVRAAKEVAMPVVISFTLETDGRLPTGQALGEAIAEVDRETGEHAAYFMINCAHPSHFEATLDAGGGWLARLKGVRANASRLSHAELDEAEELDIGDPHELAADYSRLRRRFPHISIVGGCCGTDHRHIGAIGDACTTAQAA